MVKILNGEIVPDDDPRLQTAAAAAAGGGGGAAMRQRPVGRVRHDTTPVVEEGEGFLGGLGIDLSSYLGENSQPVFTTPSVELPGGREIPEIPFTVQTIFIVAVVYVLAGPRGLLAVGFLWGLTKLSEGSGGAINAAAGVDTATATPAGGTANAATVHGGGAVPARGAGVTVGAGASSPRPGGSLGGGAGQRLGASGGSGQSRLLREMDAAQD
jgi:hypothetical protein